MKNRLNCHLPHCKKNKKFLVKALKLNEDQTEDLGETKEEFLNENSEDKSYKASEISSIPYDPHRVTEEDSSFNMSILGKKETPRNFPQLNFSHSADFNYWVSEILKDALESTDQQLTYKESLEPLNAMNQGLYKENQNLEKSHTYTSTLDSSQILNKDTDETSFTDLNSSTFLRNPSQKEIKLLKPIPVRPAIPS